MNPRLQAGVELQLEKQARDEETGSRERPRLAPLPGGVELSPGWHYGVNQKADIRKINEDEIAFRKKQRAKAKRINEEEAARRAHSLHKEKEK